MDVSRDIPPEYPASADLPPEYASVYTDSFDILPRDAGAEVYDIFPVSTSSSSQSDPVFKCKLLTRANKSRIKPPIPTYFGGDLVRGVLEIRCESSSGISINSIIICVRLTPSRSNWHLIYITGSWSHLPPRTRSRSKCIRACLLHGLPSSCVVDKGYINDHQ